MPIPVSCARCRRKYNVKSKLAGHRFRCKSCSQVILVPGSATRATVGISTASDLQSAGDPDSDREFVDTVTVLSMRAVSAAAELPDLTPPETPPPNPLPKLRSSERPAAPGPVPWGALLGGATLLLIAAVVATFGMHNKEPESPQPPERGVDSRPSLELIDPQGRLNYAALQNFLSPDRARLVETHEPDWREFSFPDEPIAIQMPAEPAPLTRSVDGVTLVGATVNFEPGSGGVYGVLLIDYTVPSDQSLNLAAQFAGTKQELITGLPAGGIAGERDVFLTDEGDNLHPGREFQIEGLIGETDLTLTCRIYMVGTRLVIAFTGADRLHAGEFKPDADSFLDSLKITASVPPLGLTRESESLPGPAESAASNPGE